MKGGRGGGCCGLGVVYILCRERGTAWRWGWIVVLVLGGWRVQFLLLGG